MKCPKCSKEIANDSVFCEYCGVRVKIEEKGTRVRWRQLFLWFVSLIVVILLNSLLNLRFGLDEILLIVVLITVVFFFFSILNSGRSSN